MTENPVFYKLSDILRPYAKKLHVKTDTETNFYIEETHSSDKSQIFGAVQLKKNYTSFHLFPVYTNPSLLDEVSPELRKQMQGKSCFNFKKPEQIPSDELTALVKRAYEIIRRDIG